MGSTVVRIQYQDLSSGLHGKAERMGPSTMVYLQPGLTAAQRSAVLRRLRQEARRGCGPQLPSRQLAVAVVADRARSAVGQVLAILRLHPAGALAPALLFGMTAGLFLLVAAVPVQAPRQSGPSAVSPARVATMIGGTAPVGPGRTLGRLREYFRILAVFRRNGRPAKRAAAPGPAEGRFLE
jgi:hypothetical protein